MSFAIGDIVQTDNYGEKALFKLICFLDRAPLQCSQHAGCSSTLRMDDVHLKLLWRVNSAVVPAWVIGEDVVFPAGNLNTPSNELLVLALASSDLLSA